MTWGYWKHEPIPVVSKYKWLEPRHMVNISERWARDRTDGLQSAFFNGVGYESWENVWGIWNQFTPRDAEALRRIATIERAMADLLIDADWEPHVATLQPGIYASRFQGDLGTLWLLVNRTDKTVAGDQLEVPGGRRALDLWHGTAFPDSADKSQKHRLNFEIEANGFGAVLSLNGAKEDQPVSDLVAKMHSLSKTKLRDLSAEWKPLPQTMVEIAKTKPASQAPQAWSSSPPANSPSKCRASRSKASTSPASTSNIRGKTFPAGITTA